MATARRVILALLALLALGAAAGALIPPGIMGRGPTPQPAVSVSPGPSGVQVAPDASRSDAPRAGAPQGMSTTRQVGPASARIISSSATSTTGSPTARSDAATPG